MIFSKKENTTISETELFVPVFGYELLKNDLLPELLGKDHNTILYWAGKSIARKYPTTCFEEIIDFFNKAGWGDLILVKETRSEATFELTSQLFTDKKNFSTPLESGFLAQQIELIKGYITETNEVTKNGKNKKIIYHVKWDRHDKAEYNNSY